MIRSKESFGLPTIDLDGPDGNAWSLFARANDIGRQLGYSEEVRWEIVEKMKAGNYINLLKVFDEYYGDFVILETCNDDLLEKLS